MSLYKPCDIRGPVDQLSPDLYRTWGGILAGDLPPGAAFLVGGDVRPSSGSFREAFLDGVGRAGARGVDLGTLPTPMVYFAKRHLQAPACAVVTASHSPPGVNGLKWMVGDLPPTEAQVEWLRQRAEAGAGGDGRPGGGRDGLDVAPAYRAWLRQCLAGAGARARAILDPGGGCWAGRARDYLAEVFPGCQFVALHDRVDGWFRQRDPDTARPQHLRELVAQVLRERADLGIAYDGDGDRVAFVDAEGQVLTAEQAAWILAQGLASQWPGRAFVYDLKASRRLPEAVAALGGRPVAQRSGHAFIRTSMVREGALFGAEVSGHFFFGELAGGDDGLFATGALLQLLAASGRSLSAWRQACPPMFTTPDLRVSATAQEAGEAIARIRREYAGRPQDDLDGVRVGWPAGWALVRRSVTAAELTFRFEGDSPQALAAIVADVAGRLGALGPRLWAQYEDEGGRR